MVKKMIKYSKFVLCIALILSLVAPSYAALSASDGSAFVTKAEFDSALADFNARLTTFEAGINSKIDSQVTSYLDRNGIWNGKVQVVNGGILPVAWGSITAPSHMNDQWPILRVNDLLVTKITKSGLCRFRTELGSRMTAIISSGGTNYPTGAGNEISCYILNGPCSGLTAGSTVSGSDAWLALGNNCLTNMVLLTVSTNFFGSSSQSAWAAPAGSQETYFFVDKDKPLYSNIVITGCVWGQNCAGKTLALSDASGQAQNMDLKIWVY